MRKGVLVAFGLALLGCNNRPKPVDEYTSGADPQKVTTVGVREVSAAGDTSIYRVTYVLNKAPRPGDSVRVRFHRDSVTVYGAFNNNQWRFKQKDSADFKLVKVYDTVGSYLFGARVQSGSYVGAEKTSTFTTNLKSPPPTVDTLKVDSTLSLIKLDIKPDSFNAGKWYKDHGVYLNASGQLSDSLGRSLGYTCPAGGAGLCPQQRFCPLWTFKGGKIAMPTDFKGIATCDSAYAQVPSTARAVSTKQQQIADTACIKWSATGGSIVASTCQGVPS